MGPIRLRALIGLLLRLRITSTRTFHVNGLDASRRFPLPEFFRRSCGTQAKQRPPFWAAENTSNRSAARHSYALPLASLAVNAHESALAIGRDPDGPVPIKTNSVRLLHAPEPATKVEFAVAPYVVLGQTITIHFRDD